MYLLKLELFLSTTNRLFKSNKTGASVMLECWVGEGKSEVNDGLMNPFKWDWESISVKA